jgi:hypothetical protein
MVRCVIVTFVLLIVSPSLGQESDQETSMQFGGFVDGYYAFEFTRPPGKDRSFTTQPLRHNEFNLNLALFALQYNTERVHGKFGLQAGTYVESNYAAEPAGLQRIHEAFVGLRLGQSDWWVDMGLMASHIGFESAISSYNWTYSRALMADFSPFYETGMRLSGPVSETATFTLVVVNGWQNLRETNDEKALGTQIQIQHSDRFSFNWSTFLGNEQPDSQPWQPRIFNNFFGQFQISEKTDGALIFDVGFQKKPSAGSFNTWYAAAIYGRHQMTETISMAGRLEYFADKNQVIAPTGTPNGFQTLGASLNLDYAPTDHFVWRIEARGFRPKDRIYPSYSGFDRLSGFLVSSFAVSID